MATNDKLSPRQMPVTRKDAPLPEGLVIAAISVAGYLAAFCYEAGRAVFFGYPLHLIHVSIEAIFLAVAAISVGIVVFGTGLEFVALTPSVGRNKHLLRAVGMIIAALAMVAVAHFMFTGFLLFALLILLFFSFVGYVISRHGRTKPDTNASGQLSLADSLSPVRAVYWLAGSSWSRAAELAFLLLVTASLAGTGKAAAESEFLVFASAQNVVVFRIYDDMVIAGEVNLATREITNVLRVATISDQGIVMKTEEVGRLRTRNGALRVMLLPPVEFARTLFGKIAPRS
jgi:hypothetical protein